MSVWATNRRLMYISGVVAFFAVTIGVPAYFILKKPPTCFDGKLNQDERGVDCGGVCTLVCKQDVSPLAVLWSRTFFVSGSVYNSVAYIENPNVNAVALNVPYVFRVFDEQNILITERTGTTNIMDNGTVPIFEGAIDMGWRKPARTFFEFTKKPVWIKKPAKMPHVTVVARSIQNANTSPRLEAQLYNDEVYDVRTVEVVATIFDEKDNALAVSRTVVPLLSGQESKNLIFTWPRPFEGTSSRIEVIARSSPQKSLTP